MNDKIIKFIQSPDLCLGKFLNRAELKLKNSIEIICYFSKGNIFEGNNQLKMKYLIALFGILLFATIALGQNMRQFVYTLKPPAAGLLSNLLMAIAGNSG